MCENRDSSANGSSKCGTPENELTPAHLKRLLKREREREKKEMNTVAQKVSVVLFPAHVPTDELPLEVTHQVASGVRKRCSLSPNFSRTLFPGEVK